MNQTIDNTIVESVCFLVTHMFKKIENKFVPTSKTKN